MPSAFRSSSSLFERLAPRGTVRGVLPRQQASILRGCLLLVGASWLIIVSGCPGFEDDLGRVDLDSASPAPDPVETGDDVWSGERALVTSPTQPTGIPTPQEPALPQALPEDEDEQPNVEGPVIQLVEDPPPNGQAPSGAPASPPPQHRIVLSDGAIDPKNEAGASSFPINGTREIHVYSLWDRLSGFHTERREFIAPSGERYYQKLLAFSSDISEEKPFSTLHAIPHAQTVQPTVISEDGYQTVADIFGIAGTWIGQHSLTGQWLLRIYLDGSATPTVSVPFELTE